MIGTLQKPREGGKHQQYLKHTKWKPLKYKRYDMRQKPQAKSEGPKQVLEVEK